MRISWFCTSGECQAEEFLTNASPLAESSPQLHHWWHPQLSITKTLTSGQLEGGSGIFVGPKFKYKFCVCKLNPLYPLPPPNNNKINTVTVMHHSMWCPGLGEWADSGDSDTEKKCVMVGFQNSLHLPGSMLTFVKKFNIRVPQCQ